MRNSSDMENESSPSGQVNFSMYHRTAQRNLNLVVNDYQLKHYMNGSIKLLSQIHHCKTLALNYAQQTPFSR